MSCLNPMKTEVMVMLPFSQWWQMAETLLTVTLQVAQYLKIQALTASIPLQKLSSEESWSEGHTGALSAAQLIALGNTDSLLFTPTLYQSHVELFPLKAPLQRGERTDVSSASTSWSFGKRTPSRSQAQCRTQQHGSPPPAAQWGSPWGFPRLGRYSRELKGVGEENQNRNCINKELERLQMVTRRKGAGICEHAAFKQEDSAWTSEVVLITGLSTPSDIFTED